MLMLRPITKLNFNDLTDVIPAFITIALMSFTYNIGIGMTAGFVFYPIAKLVGGKSKEIHPGMWILFGVSILFYVFYPY